MTPPIWILKTKDGKWHAYLTEDYAKLHARYWSKPLSEIQICNEYKFALVSIRPDLTVIPMGIFDTPLKASNHSQMFFNNDVNRIRICAYINDKLTLMDYPIPI